MIHHNTLRLFGEWGIELDREFRKSKSYQKLIRKVYLKIIGILLGAGVAAMVLRSLFRGKFGNFVTTIYCHKADVSWEEAVKWYYMNIRDYYAYIIAGVLLIFFLIFLRVLVEGFGKYFDNVTQGIYKLTEDDNSDAIHLMPELEEVEDELNHVKNELRRRTQEKEQAEKRKDELVVYLAHDIKTPLTSVIGYLDLLEQAENLTEEQRERYIHIAREKAGRLEKLMNEFFEITRSHAQPIPLEKMQVNLSFMLVQIVDEAYPISHENHKTIVTNIPEEIMVYVDPEKMARVFQNLLKNAIYYSDTQSEIRITAEEKENQIMIKFINDGDIPDDKLIHIFDKFYRLDEARQTRTGGAGLGLAIAKELVSLHRGTLQVRCENHKIIMEIALPKNI